MPRRLVSAIVAAAAGLAVAAPAANAFDTGPHTDLTREAMRAEGFGMPAADVGAINNYFVDMYTNSKEVPYSGDGDVIPTLIVGAYGQREHWKKEVKDAASILHFDDQHVRLLMNKERLAFEWSRLRRSLYGALQDAKASHDPLDVLTALGISLHEVQDFYAHTNWVEPVDPDHRPEQGGPDWQARGLGSTPTWFDVPPAELLSGSIDIYPGSKRDDDRVHGNWRQDRNLTLTSAMAKDWPGRPFYDQAFMTSWFASRQWIQAARNWLGDDALWQRAQAFDQWRRELAHDVTGAYLVPTYVGHWAGEGGPCDYVLFGCGDTSGDGGSALGAANATKAYFEIYPGGTHFRKRFERIVPNIGFHEAEVSDDLVPVPSSQAMQRDTRFVKLQMTKVGGGELGDIGPDDADLYGEATIAGQRFRSPIIQGHDTFSFPRPYGPFTFIAGVSRSEARDEPVREILVRIRTANNSRNAGTDDDVYLRTSSGQRFPLDKRLYDDFERGDTDTYSVPIDRLARTGFTLGDITMLQIEKSRDGYSGGWKLGGATITINGDVVVNELRIERWLEDNHRTWRATGFQPRGQRSDVVPVSAELLEDDLNGIYGGDDQGDLNFLDARDVIVRGYRPGAPYSERVRGGERYSGRLGKDGDDTSLTFTITTLDPLVPLAIPKPTGPVVGTLEPAAPTPSPAPTVSPTPSPSPTPTPTPPIIF